MASGQSVCGNCAESVARVGPAYGNCAERESGPAYGNCAESVARVGPAYGNCAERVEKNARECVVYTRSEKN